jgi:hypothetical protein
LFLVRESPIAGARMMRFGIALTVMLLVGVASTAQAQSYAYRWDNGSGNNNWGTGQNWGLNPPLNLGVNNVTPNAFFEEQGLINNGNTVNVATSQTQFSASAADNAAAAAGVTVDGVTAPGNGSTLNIASGGSLSLRVTYGPNGAPPSATPTAGTGNATLNNGGVLTVQPGGTLTAQGDIIINNGRLTVGGAAAGGQVSAGNLRAPNVNGTVNLMGSAVVNLTNGAVLNGTTTITGPNVVFNTPSISMSASAVFNPVITSPAVAAGTGHSVINVTGGVSLGGTLRPQFQNGVVPQLGNTWTLWDSAQVQGNFTTSDATAPGAGLPTGLRYAITTTTAGSVRGVKGQLTVENFLTAEVNRATGQVSIRNTNTTVGPGVTITGYQIGSPAGALRPTSFSSAFGGSWEAANLTANSIAELNPAGSSVVGLGASASTGNIYNPVQLQTTFGTAPVSDLTFSYTRSDARTVIAPVTYVGTGLANTLVLQVDPTDGKARIVNDSVFNNIRFDGYQVASVSGSLMGTWNSLQDQAVTGWEEASMTANLLAELNPSANTSVNAGQTAATMTGLFRTAGGVQDLAFQFRVPGTGPGTGVLNGVVRYAPFTAGGLPGDYNDNGVVDAADYVVWRKTDGTPAGYSSWRTNFGRTSGSGASLDSARAVPEPSALITALAVIGGLLFARYRTTKSV